MADQERFYAGSVHFRREGDPSWTRIAAAGIIKTRLKDGISFPNLQACGGPVDGGFWIVETTARLDEIGWHTRTNWKIGVAHAGDTVRSR